MNVEGNGLPLLYRIAVSGAMAASIKQEQLHATLDGKGDSFLAAIEYVVARMRHDPHNLGEPIFPLHKMNVIAHLAFIPPLTIEFGIHQHQPIVFLRRTSYIPPP
jgi:hypothetical protein